MSAILNFRYGDFINLPTESESTLGTVFITTDEQAMYVDLPKIVTNPETKEEETVVNRIRIGDIITIATVEDLIPPFSEGAFYYVEDRNALLRWSGGEWKQINSTKAITDELATVRQMANDNKAAIDDMKSDIADKVEALQDDIDSKLESSKFDTYEQETDKAIAEAKKAADDAQDDADAALVAANTAQATGAQGVADAAAARELAESKASLADVANAGYATQTYVNEQDAILLGSADDSTSSNTIHGAKKAAAEAKQIAEGAEQLAASKITLDEVKALGYDTVESVNAKDSALLGTSADDSSAITIYGAKKAAQEALEAGNQGIADASTALGKANDAHALANGAQGAAQAAQARADEGVAAAQAASDKADLMLPKAGGTMTGPLIMSGETATISGVVTPTENDHAANKAYVDAAKTDLNGAISDVRVLANNAKGVADAALPKAGGTVTGQIAMSNNKITGLATPENDADAANKSYVDAAIAAGFSANDAMTFKGVLGKENGAIEDLPSIEDSSIGDTYKVGTAGTYGDIAAKVGDLFVYVKNDNEDPSWVHISSGYEDDYLQKLLVDGVNSTIYLTDGVNNDSVSTSPAGIQFVGDSYSNIKFTVSAGNPDPNTHQTVHKVTATMTWGTF